MHFQCRKVIKVKFTVAWKEANRTSIFVFNLVKLCMWIKKFFKKKKLLIAGSNHLNLHKMSLSQIKFKYHIFTPFLQIYSDDTKNIKINIVLQDYDNFLFCIKYSFSKLIILIVSLCIIWLGKFQIISFKLNVKIDNNRQYVLFRSEI